MFSVLLLPAILYLLGLILVPESPRWLIQRERSDEAAKIVTKITGDYQQALHFFYRTHEVCSSIRDLSQQNKGKAMSVSIMTMWIADAIIGQLTPIALRQVGAAATFWFISFFCVVGFCFVLRYLPETKGRSLEQIQRFKQSAVA